VRPVDLPPLRIVIRSVGGGVGIALMTALADGSGQPLMTVPFATSIVLVMGLPDSRFARPRCIVGGHFVSAFVGVACTLVLGEGLWASVFGVGLAMGLMLTLDVFHPPAGISPLIITAAHATPLFILSPAASGALILLAFAYAYHNLTGEKWPERWT
jgi:CBS-domain-containing membrane protein